MKKIILLRKENSQQEEFRMENENFFGGAFSNKRFFEIKTDMERDKQLIYLNIYLF